MEQIDWKTLPFSFIKTDYNVRCYFRDGKWGKLEVSNSDQLTMPIASTCLHYGQESFEGLKAYRGQDGKIRIFRWNENAKRMINSAKGVLMEPVPEEIFHDAVCQAVKLNERFVPPYGSGATLYIRPLLIGVSPIIGVSPSIDYLFMVFVSPVGPYFKSGFKPGDYLICREFDRAAPLGTGTYKVGGNYAASLKSLSVAKEKGYTSVIYLDPKEKKYLDECGPSNFFAIKNNTYITPKSTSILPSVTNMSLIDLAKDMGLKVEARQVPVEELETFEEAGGCGTAAVISPIRKIVDEDKNKTYLYGNQQDAGPVCTALYQRLTAIQFGDEDDKFGWVEIIK
jgi:branched-chain amino acid aminotransferase